MKTKSPPVLSDHIRNKKKFRHPLLETIGTEGQVNYVNEILPELIWVGLIQKFHDFAFMARSFNALINRSAIPKSSTFPYASSFLVLPDEIRGNILEIWNSEGVLSGIRRALLPLNALIDGSPTAFIGLSETYLSKEQLIRELKATTETFYFSRSTEATLLVGSTVLYKQHAGTLLYREGLEVADYNSIFTDPNGDAAARAKASLRALSLLIHGEFRETRVDWPKRFWNSCRSLESCEVAREHYE